MPLLTRRQRERELLERLDALAKTANDDLLHTDRAIPVPYAVGVTAGKAEAYRNAALLAHNWLDRKDRRP